MENYTTKNGQPATRQTLMGRATNRAMRELRRRHYSEYYQIYCDELDKLGVRSMPTSGQMKAQQIVSLLNEVEMLKQLLAENNIEVRKQF